MAFCFYFSTFSRQVVLFYSASLIFIDFNLSSHMLHLQFEVLLTQILTYYTFDFKFVYFLHIAPLILSDFNSNS